MGNIILLNDIYDYELPPVPSDEKQILYYNQPRERQYWQRPGIPYGIREWSQARQEEWISDEITRCFDTGQWVFIDGEPTWIDPYYWWFLNWWYTSDGYFKFRFNQLWESLFWDKADKAENCIGTVQFKKRRDGLTTRIMARIIWKAIHTREAWFGIQSKTGNDAKKVCWKILMTGFKRLPHFFRPVQSGNTDPKTMLEFKEPSKRLTQSNVRDLLGGDLFGGIDEDEESEDLNTTIDFRDTVADAYDGQRCLMIALDEFAKWEKANVEDAITTYKKSCSIDGVKYGMIHAFSSPNERDSDAHKTSLELWDGSFYKDVKDSLSLNMWNWFTSSLDSWAPAIDKFGRCNQELAQELILAERATAKPKKLKAVIRQTAMNVQEIIDAAESTVFSNIEEIRRRKNFLKQISHKDILKSNPKYTYGDFIWKNGIIDTAVEFVPSPDQDDFSESGRFAIAYFPVSGTPNKMDYVIKKGKAAFKPILDSEYVIGIDPYDYRRTDSDNPSNGAAVCGRCFDLHGQGGLNDLAFIYNNRPKGGPHVFYEDMLMASVFYNAFVNAEAKNMKIFDHFEDRGYFDVMLPKIMTDTKKKDIKGTPTTNPVIQQICTLIDTYTSSDLNHVWFEELLQDIELFDPEQTKRSNLTMAFGHMLIGFTKRRRFYKPRRRGPVNTSLAGSVRKHFT